MVRQNEDLADLDVTGSLRHGIDITVTVDGRELRLLSVHLKSGCFDRPLTLGSDDCRKLGRQVPELEEWIDEQAAADAAFAVLGDFNRRFDTPGDTFWPEIDDQDPPGADLMRVTEGRTSECWGGQFPIYIDHIVLGPQAARGLVADSFEQVLFAEAIELQNVLSDHCAIAVTLDLPGPEAAGLKGELLRRIEAVERELEALEEVVRQLD
jgi:endonuclease/exonuclease/phosphatase family metal-dependent hydrolase